MSLPPGDPEPSIAQQRPAVDATNELLSITMLGKNQGLFWGHQSGRPHL
jgi:hypothetical protein